MLIDQFNLDRDQRQAVTYTGGPLLVYAGPGAGKTRTLAARASYLIESGLNPSGIYLATFTRRARAEMSARLAEVLDPTAAGQVQIMTIDATAYRILRALERVNETNPGRQFRVCDDETLYEHFRETLSLTGFDSARLSGIEAWKEIKAWKGSGRDPKRLPADLVPLSEKFDQRLAEARLWDVSDLVPLAIEALEQKGELAAAFNVQAFLLDEYQDTALLQFRFIQKLLGPCRNFFAVGAPSQSIYGFRAADPTALTQAMCEHFGEITIARLSTNYRSGRKIFEAAAALVPAAPDLEDIRSRREDGAVYLAELENEAAEANFVTAAIRRILSSNPGLRYREIAVLFRTWAQSDEIQTALSRSGLPFRFGAEDRLPFWEKAEVAALTGYLRAIQSIRDAQGPAPKLDGALDVILNQPPRGIGPTSQSMILDGSPELSWERLIASMGDQNLRPQVRAGLKALFELLAGLAGSQITRPRELAREVIRRTGWLEAAAQDLDFSSTRALLEEKYLSAADRFTTLPDLLAFAYRQMRGSWNVDGVTLSSVHGAKGLEWPVVFIIGMNEGLFPSAQAATDRELAEEARTAHVAASRAKDLLICTWTRTRTTSSGTRPARPSRFLANIQPFAKEFDDDSFTYPGYNPSPGLGRPFQAGPDALSAAYHRLPGDL
jgi:ATP-dependent DNA helicase UvrD/PcrA